ncbi:MAG: Maf family protein [Planctomycetes bacterium]|nr:Maf family protein [Planctomycetota bacterium]
MTMPQKLQQELPQGLPRQIVLASGSQQRLALALAEGWEVRVVPPPEAIEASAAPRTQAESLEEYVLRLARTKGQAVADMTDMLDMADRAMESTIIACDTLSEVHGTALGKPADRADARRMLEMLSGRVHRVLTGVWLWRPKLTPHPPAEAVEESLLEMEPLSESFLEWYLDSGMWLGKAGACGFQDERLPLRLIEGSGSNVVGLPLERVRAMLATLDDTRRQP